MCARSVCQTPAALPDRPVLPGGPVPAHRDVGEGTQERDERGQLLAAPRPAQTGGRGPGAEGQGSGAAGQSAAPDGSHAQERR